MKTAKSMVMVSCLALFSLQASSVETIDISKPVYEAPITEETKKLMKEAQDPERVKQHRDRFIEYVKSSERDFVFQGKVVDFDGNPVSGAIVVLSVRKFDPAAEYFMNSDKPELTTDSKGSFRYKGSGISIHIRDIIKEGYEFKNEYLEFDHFAYDLSMKSGPSVKNLIPFDAKSEGPFVFKIRKYGVVDYLVTDLFHSWSFRKSQNKAYCPLVLGEWNDAYGHEMNLSAHSFEKNKCLEISCTFNESYSEFHLLFRCTVEDSGIILSEKLLYEAPENGYQKEITYDNTLRKPTNDGRFDRWHDKLLYLYVQGPGKSYYSRLNLSLTTDPPSDSCTDPYVHIGWDVYTNPLGRRYLEYNQNYNQKERVVRGQIQTERSKERFNSQKEKKELDEEAFKRSVDQKRKGGFYNLNIQKR
jgi:hypothetical protein